MKKRSTPWWARSLFHPDHSADEERYIIVGQSRQDRLFVVSYTERKNLIRLISVREATRSEKDAYEER